MVNSGKKFALTFLISVALLLLVFVVATYIYDPFFHYHKPYDWVSYDLNYQRYQNDGILKHFDYDAIIIGTSMIENSKTTEMNEIFDVNSVKIPLSGASNKEIKMHLLTAIEHNENIKIIIRTLDLPKMLDTVDTMRYEDDYYPWYLYDNTLYNDVKYVFNKSIFFKYTVPTIKRTNNNEPSKTFDDYSKWYDIRVFSKAEVVKNYNRGKKSSEKYVLTDNDKKNILENITQNVLKIAQDNPNIEFYLFIPPYSICFWDSFNQNGTLHKMIDTIEYAFNILIDQENIHLYSFVGEKDVILNLDNYKDITHYNEKINYQMLIWMKEEHDLITRDNFKEYIKELRTFFTNYDYDKIFEK